MSKLGHQLDPLTRLIIRPHVTERSTAQSLNELRPVYTFVVAESATKATVAQAVSQLYGVRPTKVATITVRPKSIFVRGRWGKKPGFKKALVYLKKGDKIEFV